MHPVIAEICRNQSSEIRPDVFRRWQKQLRDEVQPQLDRLAELDAAASDRKERKA